MTRARIWILTCLILAVSADVRAQDTKVALETQKERESYSIGYQVGLSMRADGVEADFDSLIEGLRDAIDRKDPRISEDEMKRLILDLKKRAKEAQARRIQELTVKNAEETKRYLEENAKKKGVRTTASGLQYVILKEGEGDSPAAEDTLTVHYKGTFPDGTEFDSSYAKGQPQVFRADGVIKGWTEALLMMKAGAKWNVVVPPELAYGRAGLGDRIGPNKTLIFEIDLLSFQKEK